MTSLADVEYWKRPLRYHYCCVHDLLCGFPKFLPPGSGEHSNPIYDGSFLDVILPSERPEYL